MIRSARFLAVALMATLAGGVHAITFSGLGGSMATGSGLIGSNGFFIQSPAFVQNGVGTMTATFTWTVNATPGFLLTSVKLQPNALVSGGGSISISAPHPADATATLNFFSAGPAIPAPTTTALSGTFSSYNVTATVTLNVPPAMPPTPNFAKQSVFQAFYTEQPVPEPATMAALALGVAGIAARRNKGGKA
jgi:hypothetical protein